MSSYTDTISLDHDNPNDPDEPCCMDISFEFDLEHEPADPSVGYMNESWSGTLDFTPPDKCDECGHVYTEDEKKELGRLAQKAFEDYEPSNEYCPEPEDLYDR